MIDCYPDPDHNVCESGAAFEPILDYVRDKGLTSWDEYPYQAKKNGCDRDREGRTVARINGWNWVAGGGDEGALHLAVQDHGPSAIFIHASDSWASYRQGIYDGPCDGDLNHAVLVVGYGYDKPSDMGYWIVKNSWGEGYGDHGYVHMRKDGGNMCRVADHCVQVS
ncbi:unnamed protein product [Oppiella nova]|uniref:Peptidase C1A papain C-terminal domain-containing protein n=1 Tax=Oppiella nova TaxID=334625 RepID=A0A7R9QYS5_9ACAR|nr:unnamed protein product [Oppiella nova]CAG2180593.1 unnamed protein product [Oppiella nova]